jgi:hypothetical protein
MVEILFFAQLARRPLQAMARRWWCRSLYRASRGQRRCRNARNREAWFLEDLVNSWYAFCLQGGTRRVLA